MAINFKYLSQGGISKLKKEGGSMVQGQIIFTFNYFTLYKIVLCIWRELFFSVIIILWYRSKYSWRGGEGMLALFLFNFFQIYYFYFKLLYPLQNCVINLTKNYFFYYFATIILWKKVILSCLNINLKIFHKLR